MRNSTCNISGLVPVLATPFAVDGSLDLASLRNLVAFELGCGVDGIGVLGYASEAPSLDDEERMLLIEAVAAELDGRVPLVVGLGWGSRRSTSDQAKAAADAGADMLMLMPPERANAQQVLEFYRDAADASPLPLMIQDAPNLTGTVISPSTLESLCAVDGIAALKIEAQPTPLKVSEAMLSAAGRIDILGGQNALFMLEEIERGAVGTMPGCEFSDGLRRVLDLYASGSKADARALFNLLLPLIRYGMQPGLGWAVHKEVLRLGGVIETSVVRPPGLALDPMGVAGLRTILGDLADVELAVLDRATL